MLCLGDVWASRLEALRKQQGNQTLKEVSTLSARGKQLVRGLIALASVGHRVILGIVDVDLLATATTWLERAGARLLAVADASDIEAGRESIVADVQLGLQAQPRTTPRGSMPTPIVLGFGQWRLGTFVNEKGLEMLYQRKRRLTQLTRLRDLVNHCEPPKIWKTAELLGNEGPTPGPGAFLRQPSGLRFEFEQLQIPHHYLRDAGMEMYSPALWQSLCNSGAALETRDIMELEWWSAGATEAPITDGMTSRSPAEDVAHIKAPMSSR